MSYELPEARAYKQETFRFVTLTEIGDFIENYFTAYPVEGYGTTITEITYDASATNWRVRTERYPSCD